MELFVDKDVDLMRSTFVAVGIAKLLDRIPPNNTRHEVRIEDQGGCYLITCSLDVDTMTHYVEESYETGLPPLLPAIRKPYSAKEQKLIDNGTPEAEVKLKYVPRDFPKDMEIDYGREKQISDDARKARRKKNESREEGEIPPAKSDFPVWAHLCSYFVKGAAMRVGYPSIIHTWYAHQDNMATELWKLILYSYGEYPNRISEARDIWHKEFRKTITYDDYKLSTDLSSLAIVSPSTSKGVSDLAGYNSLSENTPNTFWLEMYFAFTGYMTIAMPYNVGSDVTTFYPLPNGIHIVALQGIITKYRDSTISSLYRFSNQMNRAKLDVLNHIIYYQNMVEHYIDSINDGTLPEDFPLDAISGIVGFYYKDISTQIPFDETRFTLPAWMDKTMSLDRLYHAKDILENHHKLVSAIRGKPPKYQLTADELHLLDLYRRYTTHGQSMDWIRFTIAYSQYRFRIMTEVRGFPILSLAILKESLPMNDKQDYSGILEDPHFQKVADAINYCTVYARYKKDVQQDSTFFYKVRHGLGDDLLRNAHDPARFITDLSKFIHDYHRESMNVQVDNNTTRASVEPSDIHAITELIAQYGSNIVAHLLVASGYASRFSKTKQ